MGFLDNFKRRQPNYDLASQEYMQNISLLNPDVQLAIMGKISPNDLNTQTDYVKQGYSKESVKKEIEKNQVSNINQMNEFRQAIDNYKNRYNQMNYDESMKDSIEQYTNVAYPYGEDDDIIKNTIKNTINDYIGVYGENNNLVTGEGQASGFRENYEEAQQQKIDDQIRQIIDNSDAVESSSTNEVETSQETTIPRIVTEKPGKWITSDASKEAFKSYVNTVINDNAEKFSAKNFKADDKIDYENKVSLNVCPVSKTNVSIGVYKNSKNERLKYILGEDESGMLYKTFSQLNGVVFPYTPKVGFGYNVNYEQTEILHSNLSVNHYKNSPPPNITLQAEFTADGEDNARYMYHVIHFFRALTKCEFGSHSNRGENKDYRGFPPPVLYLNGYGNFMNNIPVVIKSFNIDLEKNKHYIYLKDENVWLPTDISMNITLGIQPNLNVYKDVFDLNEYKKNVMINSNNNGYDNIYTVNENIYGIGDKYRAILSRGNESTSRYSIRFEYGKFGVKSDKVTLQKGHSGMGWTW